MKLGAEDTKDGWWWAVMVGPCSGEFLLVFSPDRVAQDIFKPLWAHKTRVFRSELSADLFLPPPAGPVPSPEEGLRPSPPLPTAQAGGDAASGAAALATSGDSSGCAPASSGSTHQEPPQSTHFRWCILTIFLQLVIVENVEVMIDFHRKQENLLDSDPVCYPSPLSHIGSRELHIVNNFSEVRASIWSDQIATRILIWSVLGRRFGCDDDWNIEADSFASTSGMIHVHTF